MKVSRLEQSWSARLTHVLAELSLPVTSEVPLRPGAEISQDADPAAVLGSPSIYHTSPSLVSKQLPRAACKSHQATAMASSGSLLG